MFLTSKVSKSLKVSKSKTKTLLGQRDSIQIYLICLLQFGFWHRKGLNPSRRRAFHSQSKALVSGSPVLTLCTRPP